MPMTLWFKRAKSFVVPSENHHGEKKFLGMTGNPTGNVPDWVADTQTFKHGVEDGSIVNLTPPHLMPGYKAPAAEPESEEQAPSTPPVNAPETTADGEQKEIPQAPFGGQPNTPVAPAPRVGGIRAGNARGGK